MSTNIEKTGAPGRQLKKNLVVQISHEACQDNCQSRNSQ